MKLIKDWRRVVALSLSFWLQVAGVIALVLPELLFSLFGIEFDPYFAWWLGILLLLGGIIGRLWLQDLPPWREWLRIVAVAAVLAVLALFFASSVQAAPASEQETLSIAVPFIAEEEGERTIAYLDIVGVPTICFGSTRGVQLGMVKSHAECIALLRQEVAEYRAKLHRYFTEETIWTRLPPKRDAAYTSLAFNVGYVGAGKSTAVRRLNAGDIAGGCKAITWWNRAGKRIIRGLVNRRAREFALCMDGL